jgi:GNAT superfamily N-acetyltransferase
MPFDPAYTLRAATPDDVPALQRLIDASVRGLAPGYYDEPQIEAGMRYIFGVDTQLIADGTYFAVARDDALVACGGWSGRRTLFGGDQRKQGPDTRLDPASEPARIRAFFVHPAHARRGLGRRLYEVCAREAGAAGFTRFELLATLSGVPLYEALGFVTVEDVVVTTPGGVALRGLRMAKAITADCG